MRAPASNKQVVIDRVKFNLFGLKSYLNMYGQRKSLRSAGGAGNPEPSSQSTQSQALLADSQMSSQLADDASSDNEEPEEYGDMHKLVLQGVMAAGFLDAKGVKKLFQESYKHLNRNDNSKIENVTSPLFIQRVVREINDRIKNYDMMIRSATCEITGEKFYVFLVTIERPVMKLQTFFSKMELDLFQKILDLLLRKHNNFCMSMSDCINIVGDNDTRSFTKVNAEDFINKMIELNYFTKVYKDKKSKEFTITLGFRTIREFEPIFRDVYADIFGNCGLCKMILLNGLQCPKCPAVIHRACLKKYIKSCKTCTSCKGFWKNEDALVQRTRDGSNRPPQTSQESEKDDTKQKGKSVGTGDDVDMPVLEPVTSPRTARSGTKQNKKRSSSSKENVKNSKKRAGKRRGGQSSDSE